MKKMLTSVLFGIMLLSMSVTAFAASNRNDDLSFLTDEIVATVNDVFSDKLSHEITASDIDYANAYKIYVGENVFEMDSSNVDELASEFGNDGYIYELPVYINGDTIIVNLSKGQALNENVEFTEEERQEILANEGKWEVTGIKYYEGEIVNYTSELQKSIKDIPENVMLVGGLPYFRYAVALLADNDGNIQELVPLSDVPGIENVNELRTSADNVYDYQQIKEFVNQLPKTDFGEMGDYGFPDTETNSFNYGFLVAGIVIFLCVGGSVYVFKKEFGK